MGLIALASASSAQLTGVVKGSLLATLVAHWLPPSLAFTSSVAVALACFTTSIALTIVFSDFLRHDIFDSRVTSRQTVLFSAVITFMMSLLGFEIIAVITSVLMQIFYPCLILMLLMHAAKFFKGKITKNSK